MASPASPRWARGLLAVAAGLGALLLLEGGSSLLRGRSLVRRAPVPPADAPARPDDVARVQRDEERFAAAASNPGVYRVHADPLVGYVLKADSELEVARGRVRSDALGLRRRSGPAPAPDPVRVAVVGDSVAFGFGLDDEACLAQQLEDVLAQVRGDAPRPGVMCRTVAIPGWNHRNQVAFLLDHLDALDPDWIVYLPIVNDVRNTDGVWETGHRRQALDPAQADPWLTLVAEADSPFLRRLARRVARGEAGGDPEHAGRPLLTSDVLPESRRRYDDLVASVLRLEALPAPLLMVTFTEHELVWVLRDRLARAGVPVPVVACLTETRAEDRLDWDPHPNAETVRAMAIWVAGALLDAGLDAGAGHALPPVPARLVDRRAPPRSDAEASARAESLRALTRDALRPAFDVTTLEGVFQLVGGVNTDGSVGTRMLVGLRRAGPTLDVELAPIAGRPDLYPLAVSVLADGEPVGEVVVAGSGRAAASFALPPSGEPVLEVTLVPERWVVVDARGTSQLAAFEPVRIACR